MRRCYGDFGKQIAEYKNGIGVNDRMLFVNIPYMRVTVVHRELVNSVRNGRLVQFVVV